MKNKKNAYVTLFYPGKSGNYVVVISIPDRLTDDYSYEENEYQNLSEAMEAIRKFKMEYHPMCLSFKIPRRGFNAG